MAPDARFEKHDWREFQDLIASDVLGKLAQELSDSLRQPGMVREWHSALVALKQDIEVQMSQRRADALLFRQDCFREGHPGKARWFAYEVEYKAWKSDANRFKTSVEIRLAEAKQLIRDTPAAAKEAPNSPSPKSEFMERMAASVARTELLVEALCKKLGVELGGSW